MVAVLATAVAAYHITKSVACGRTAPSIDCLQDVSFLARKLELSDAQAAAIKQLHAGFAMQVRDCCACHCAARARLGEALAADTNGTAHADAIVTEMCRAYAQSERATLDQIRRVRAVLNAEQRRRFDAMISECICQTCDMPGGKTPSGRMKHE
jgi:hypothetical protein